VFCEPDHRACRTTELQCADQVAPCAPCPHTRLQGGNRVPVRYYALVSLFAAALLTGCTGNYKFNDDHYRPLGDPQALNRGQ